MMITIIGVIMIIMIKVTEHYNDKRVMKMIVMLMIIITIARAIFATVMIGIIIKIIKLFIGE